MNVIQLGEKGSHVRSLQRSVNNRLESRRPSAQIEVDGEWGPRSKEACRIAGHLLGVDEAGSNPGRCQLVVRHPSERTKLELNRAEARMKAEDKAAAGPSGALAFARTYVGKTEYPSNRGAWGLSAWQRELAGGGSWLDGAPWCGIFVWAALTKGAHVKGLNSRCAAVSFIYADAGAGRNGWKSRHARNAGQPGDAVILFGTSTHVGLIEKRVPGGYQTIEGNTSSGNAGSQSNGGGCFRRVRPYSAVVACCRPNY
jgi:hypothetical protein